jgi:hypothetical protein
MSVQPSIASLPTVAVHHSIGGIVQDFPRRARVFCYEVQTSSRRREDAGTAALAIARLEVRSLLTQEDADLITCVLHFAGADFRCGVRPDQPERFGQTSEHLFGGWNELSLAQMVREIDSEFPGRDYTLRDLFLDERREVARLLLRETMAHYESDYLHIFEANRRLIDFLREIDSPVPRPLQVAADVAMTHAALDTTRRLWQGELEPRTAQSDLQNLAQQAQRLGARIDLAAVQPLFLAAVRSLFDQALQGRREAALQTAELIDLSMRLGLHLDLWAMQNALWQSVRSGTFPLDPEALAPLAHALWFEEKVLLERLEPQGQRASA